LGENVQWLDFRNYFLHISLRWDNSCSSENRVKNEVLSGPFSLKREGILLRQDPFSLELGRKWGEFWGVLRLIFAQEKGFFCSSEVHFRSNEIIFAQTKEIKKKNNLNNMICFYVFVLLLFIVFNYFLWEF